MRKISLLYVIVVLFFLVRPALAMFEMEGGGGGFGGGGNIEKDCLSCDGASHFETENVRSGDTSLPPDVAALEARARNNGGNWRDQNSGTSVTVSGSGANYDVSVTDANGVTTVYHVVNTSGGGGSDPNPNDGCTPSGYVYNFSCPTSSGTCTDTCGSTFNCLLGCCPPPIKPTAPTNPNPSDGATSLIGGLIVTLSVDAPSNWGRNSNCLADYRYLQFYGSSDQSKTNNLDSSVLLGTNYVNASGVGPALNITGQAAEYSKTYYWRAVACNGSPNNCTPSPVWRFTTDPLPGWWQSQFGDVFGTAVETGIPNTCLGPTCSPFLSMN